MIDISRKILLSRTDKIPLQFLRYTIVGSLAFIVDSSLLYILTEYAHIYYLLSAAISFMCGLLVNFTLSRRVIFGQSRIDNDLLEFTAFGLIGAAGLGLNQVLIWFMTQQLGIYYMYSKALSAIAVYSWNFFARRYSLYRK